MIPENIERFTTEGERQFYKFLESVAKPDSQYFVWYSPDIKGREPDFILYSHRVGLIIFEVKDWALSQIREANPKSFILRIGPDMIEAIRRLYGNISFVNSLVLKLTRKISPSWFRVLCIRIGHRKITDRKQPMTSPQTA